MLQDLDSVLVPVQSFPRLLGVGLLHLLDLIIALHWQIPQEPQDPQLPLTGPENNKH